MLDQRQLIDGHRLRVRARGAERNKLELAIGRTRGPWAIFAQRSRHLVLEPVEEARTELCL